MTTLSTMTCQWMTAPPTSPAPTRPPIRACVDDEGRPKYQVIRFHVMAPSSAAITITRPCVESTPPMVSLTVCATSWPSSAPTKFITAASVRAMRGVRARVEIDVAMALAASWKPLV